MRAGVVTFKEFKDWFFKDEGQVEEVAPSTPAPPINPDKDDGEISVPTPRLNYEES